MGLIAKFAWIALPALAGSGQVSSQGNGTNPGGKATTSIVNRSNVRLSSQINYLVAQYSHQIKSPGLWGACAQRTELLGLASKGYMSNSRDIYADKSAILPIGSVTKIVTAAIIIKLIDEGKLSFNSTVRRCLPEMQATNNPNLDATILDILCYRSGFGFPPERKNLTGLAPKDARLLISREILETPILGKVGDKYNYGPDFSILASIAERVTNQTFEQLIDRIVVNELGVRSFGLGQPHVNDLNLLPFGHISQAGDSFQNARPIPFKVDNYMLVGPAGAGYCSIEDLALFGSLLISNRKSDGTAFLSTSTFEKCLSHPYNDQMCLFGIGGSRSTIYAAGGATRGNYCLLVLSPKNGSSVALYGNSTDQNGFLNFEGLEKAILNVIK